MSESDEETVPLDAGPRQYLKTRRTGGGQRILEKRHCRIDLDGQIEKTASGSGAAQGEGQRYRWGAGRPYFAAARSHKQRKAVWPGIFGKFINLFGRIFVYCWKRVINK